MKPIGVIGVGNPLRQDDGIGIYLLEKLRDQFSSTGGPFEFIDGGTAGFSLIHVLSRFDTVVIIDAVNFHGTPGELRMFTAQQARSVKTCNDLSTHHTDLFQILDIVDRLDTKPSHLLIIGIQPQSIEYGTTLSSALQQVVDDYIQIITTHLESLRTSQ